jgi:pimeloyl-ACP methyl ester carboxylesterase
LRAAHSSRSPSQAASAYSETAVVVWSHPPARAQKLRGREAIRSFYADLLSRTAAVGPLDLNFRLLRSDKLGAGQQDTGFYRLRNEGAAQAKPIYGRFTMLFSRGSGDTRISSATMSRATEAEFEEAPGPVLFAPDEEELGSFHDAFLGRYQRADGCDVIITRSLRRLWARDGCSLHWRSLMRVSGREWTAGDRVISDKVITRYAFERAATGKSRHLRITAPNGQGRPVFAKRIEPYRIEQISFKSNDGTVLAGQIWIPNANAKRAGIVLAHGSGAQDRNGYASILAVLADALAQAGYTIVTYDKRGTGRSTGDWSRASFATLGDDLGAGLLALRSRADLVDPNQVGIGGSSQAGWVSAKAIERGATPSFVFLKGADGSAMPVTVQNRFNVEVSMRCAGFTEQQIATVLDQNEAFYAFRRNPEAARALDAKTAEAKRDPKLDDWLLPDSQSLDLTGAAWYSVIEIDFDPLPIWRDFPGKLNFVQGDQDDQTPVEIVRKRLAGFSPEKLSLHVLAGAQHLGLGAAEPCEGNRLQDLTAFHPGLFQAIGELKVR